MELKLRGRFFEIVAHLPETRASCRYPFKVSLKIGDVLVTPQQGGVFGDLFGLVRDLVRLSICLLGEGKCEEAEGDSFLFWRDMAVEAGCYKADEIPIEDAVAGKRKIYSTSLMLQDCVFSFRPVKNHLMLHFKCGNRNHGPLEIPTKDFVLDVLSLSREFLKFLMENLERINKQLEKNGCEWPFIITKGELLGLEKDVQYLKEILSRKH
ncbi:hypothetical protein FH039_04495 [Thermococcus indicus]|uniref:Uncharacterized protein n=1 Tax=Thermococcus indicus TaxID=2586643 RepID=A0A4Y5SJN8_9EURY|nr:hypothetical protein [Thermococcus indicus]QDA31005.1 hypothetical protein FH039_04495 [Thermococcus indicus]